MRNCLIYSCMNAFEGGISSGSLSSEKFVCKNTTTLFGKREKNALQKKERMDTTESQSFSLCEWEDCTAEQGGALYVHDNSNAILKVENSSFLRCDASSTFGGGIYASNITECLVQHTTFVQCSAAVTADRGGGGMMIEYVYVQSMVDDCSFQNCSSGNDGGAICIRQTNTQRQKKCVFNSLFSSCKANHSTSSSGGAIEHWNPADKVIISNCLFRNCISMCGGGAVSQQINTNNNGILFFYCFFHNNTCAKGGHDIALDGSTENNIDSSCYSTRQTGNRVSISFNSVIDKSEWLRNDFGRIRFVSSTATEPNAIDTYACGINESHPCCTISHCLTQLIPEFVTDIEILTGSISETKSVDCNTNSFTIYGQNDLSSAIQTELEASGLSLFSVSIGTLTARDFVLVYDCAYENNRGSRLFEITGTGEIYTSRLNISSGSGQTSETAFSTELINIQNGMFQMEHVNWEKTISTTSLFSLSSTNETSLTLSESTFNEIERTTSGAAVMSFSNGKANIDLNSCSFLGCGSTNSENGGSMMLCVGNENEVKVKGGSFDGCFCSTSNGLGGGILLQLLNENPDFLISSSFGTNAAKWGNDIFVISPDLEMTAKSKNIACVTDSLDSFDKVRGYDNGNNSVAIPLCIYLLPTPEEIFVSNSEETDHSHCGIVQFPCLTMKHSLTRQTIEKKVVVCEMIMMNDELAFGEQKHEIRGNDDQSGWTVSNSSTGTNAAMVTVGVETVLSKLIYSLPPSLSSHSTFISSSSQLTMSHCSLSLQDSISEMAFLFLSVESGTLSVDSFSASSITLSGNPLISLCGCIINSVLMNTLWLNMTNCNFKKIERTSGSGSCVSIDNSKDENSNGEINIEECDFEECSVMADGSRGGAINAQLKGNIQMNVISCTFTGCTAPAEEEKIGSGGGMALKLIDGDSSFVISSPVFDTDKPNTAKYGNDLFVESSNLTKSITNTSLPFVSEHLVDISLNSLMGFDGNDLTNAIPLIYFWRVIGSELFIGEDGKDVCTCGFSDYPCLSIDYSLARIPGGNERNININGKGILKKCVDLGGISVKSDDEEMCFLECLSSLEGSEGVAMKISGITHFELISFVMSSSFASGVNYLMLVDSSEGLLTVKDCSFTKNEESGEEIINFGVIKADGGTVQLEFVTMQSLSFSKDVISVLSTTTLNVKNLTMKNVELEGASGLSISKSSGRETNEEEQDVFIEWSLFEEVTQNTTNDIPIIRNVNDEPLKMVIRNTTMKKCGGTRCGKGGGMFCVLNEGGSFECSFCTISECFCSTTGRGGWLFLECTSTAEQPLNFILSNITFRDNSALRGRDVYVRCHSIDTQIVDEQFLLDLRLPFVKDLAIWGCTTDSFVGEEDLLLRVVKYQSETIFVSSVADSHTDSKKCGEFSMPCQSLNVGVQHIIPSLYSQLLISKETVIVGESSALNVTIRSLRSPSAALVHLNSTITGDSGNLITTSEKVRIESVKFNFGQLFSYSGSSIIHETSGQLSLSSVYFSPVGESENIESVVLNSILLNIENGIFHIDNCTISMLLFKKSSFLLNGDEINITNVKLENIDSITDIFVIRKCGSVVFNGVSADGVKLSEGCITSINEKTSGTITLVDSSFNNCSRNSEGASIFFASSSSAQTVLSNCSCSNCVSRSDKGSIMELDNMTDVSMHMCELEGVLAKESERERNKDLKEICEWSGSLVDMVKISVIMKYVTILNSSQGGLSLSAGNVTIEKGEFMNNNPFIEKYPSLRRNIICSDSASLTILSLKGGDGLKDNSSLWILNEGCDLRGIAGERSSPFFIPKLEEVSANENGSNIFIKFKGSLFIPCDLSFRLIFKTGDVELVETYHFEEDSFVSETEVIGRIPSENISNVADETEVSVMILFGGSNKPSSTNSFVLKNKSETEPKEDERISKEKDKIEWSLFAFIGCIIVLVIFVALFVAIIVLLRKKLKETEKKVERERFENEQIMEKIERRRRENNGGSFEMSEMPSTLLEGMTSQIPLLIDNDEEDLPEPPSMTDDVLNENDLPDLESPLPFSVEASASGASQSHSFNVISAKKPFREKEKNNIKTLHSVIHSVQGNFTLGTRAMDVVDGKEVVLAVAELFEHLISVGDERVEMIARQLCPYSIFVEEGNNEVFVLTEELEDEKEKGEMKRWKAPEAGVGDEGIEKAVVFTLGLILHETTTGEVPLSECIAEEAQDMIRDGVRPLTEGIEGEELVEAMEKMWADEPNERPTLAEVIDLLKDPEEES
ncbi:uncharacterized protein MONOS_4902 [Monocercomonoides exilis]|uniref:uncharacterized protein n=1 Tax=Monocercomonoides exilis TaxID=2049356 RepID=UPI0035596628|nr:hypothetical protein MONOS_4902 [Monocercomonoides exilis]|eukprot:MONOS_4902.1-p1 / transcript=MONOS_4902.1 / gene=MONOS_4902 / organism=Monocercomonoides_exilis_PA203 / gene_product=unspecified product / transcript_product=unspecified product / location=Mono_scaffold00137:26627-33373(+) / protein_length=2248 / sequence_SO=supercontig / SO=protein_coding / is_pseudo=false